MKQILILLTILLFSHLLQAQKTSCDTVLYQKPSVIDTKHIETSLEDLKKQSKYDYSEAPPNTSTSWLDRVLKKINNFFSDFFIKTAKGVFNQSLIIAIVGLLFLIVVLKLLGVNIMNPFGKTNEEMPISYSSLEENIYGRNFDEEIEQAFKNNDTRLAVRLLFLKTLKQLTDKKLIEWMPNKTNQYYYYSLPASHQTAFGELTKIFDYAWYGEKNIGNDDFEEIKNKFNNFTI